MQDLAMQFWEIIANSIAAKSSEIKIKITDDSQKNLLAILVVDNGLGMTQDFVKELSNPFVTTRKTRKVGLGTAFLKQMCQQCDGEMIVNSQLNQGTEVYAYVRKDNLDVPPMGDIGEMMMEVLMFADKIAIDFSYETEKGCFKLQSQTILELLDQKLTINKPQVLLWLKDYINENIAKIKEKDANEKFR